MRFLIKLLCLGIIMFASFLGSISIDSGDMKSVHGWILGSVTTGFACLAFYFL